MSFSKRLPYPGLRAFTREESDLFFGRESSVDTMVDCLAADRFMAVLGPSGSGKSSLVHTGLLDALELGLLSKAGSHWKIADMHPGGQPMKQLACALLSVRTGPAADQTDLELMTAFLRQGPRSVVEWAGSGNIPEGYNLLILADQFEELFRYADYAQREEAEAFVATLLESSSARGVSIYVVLTMRSEYLGACATIEGLAERISAGLYLAPRMDRDECREAIEGPASVVGFKVENALVNRLLNDLGSFAPWQAGEESDLPTRLARQADQLPLMQHVLNRLWLRAAAESGGGAVELKLAEYEQIGGLSGALDAHGAEVMAELGPERLVQIERVFRSLVSGSTPAMAVRRPCRMTELFEAASGQKDDVVAIVNAFRAAGCNFLRTTEEALSDDVIVDISHESLIRQWTPLRGWLENEARAGAAWRRLATAEERYSKREGGLLTGLDLQNMAAWWDSSAPTSSWAERNGGQFEAVRSFLEESKKAEARRVEAEQAQQLKERRQLIRFAAGVSVALVIFVLLGIWNLLSIRSLRAAQAALDLKNQEVAHERDKANEARNDAVAQSVKTREILEKMRNIVELYRGQVGASEMQSEMMKKLSPYLEEAAKLRSDTANPADLARGTYLMAMTFETAGHADEALQSYAKAYEQGQKAIAVQLEAKQPVPVDQQENFLLIGSRYAWFLLDIGNDKNGDAVLQELRNFAHQHESEATSSKLLLAYARLENLEARDATDHKKPIEEKLHYGAALNLVNHAIAASNSNNGFDASSFKFTVIRNLSFNAKGSEKEELQARECKIADSLMKTKNNDLRSIKARANCLLDQAWVERGKKNYDTAAEKIRVAEDVVESGLRLDPSEQELLLTMAGFENFLGNIAWTQNHEAERFAYAMSAKGYIVMAMRGRTLFQSTTTEMKDLYYGCCKLLPTDDFPNPKVELGFYKDIVEAVSRTLDAFPDAPSFAYVAADASVRMANAAQRERDTSRSDEAIADLTKAIGWFNKSGTMHGIRDLSSWSEDFSTYCKNYKERATLYAATGRTDAMLRDIKTLEDLCRPALERYPWDIYLRDSFRLTDSSAGEAFFKKGEYQRARPFLERASKWGMPESSRLLARMYREGLGTEKNEGNAKELETIAAGQTMTSVPLQADYPWGKGRFTVYVTDWPDEYPYKDKGIDDQVELLKQYNGTLPAKDIQDFRDLQKVARQDKVPFAAFMLYYFNHKDGNEQARRRYASAKVFCDQKKWAEAAQAIETALNLEPQSIVFLSLAEDIYHDELFRYDRAFELNTERVKLGAGGYDFVEKHLTTSRFADCATGAASSRADANQERIQIVMTSLEFACLTADHKPDAALAVGRRLRKDVAGLQKVGWTFSGTKNFISNNKEFAEKAPQWVSLFEALEQGDEKKAFAALDALGVPDPDKK